MSAPIEKPRRTKLGFFAGFGFLLKGIRYIARTPPIWPLALVPAMCALAVTCAFAYAGHRALHTFLPWLFLPVEHGGLQEFRDALRALFRITVYVTLFFASLFFGTLLAQPLSSSALDAIARRVRVAAEGHARDYPRVPFRTSFMRSLRVTLVALLVGTPLVVLLGTIELFFPAATLVTLPLKLVLLSFLATWDLIDYPMSLENLGVRERTAWLSQHRSLALGFGVGVALLSAIPFVGLFLLPCGVAGVTMLRHSTTAPPLPRGEAKTRASAK